MDHFNFLQAWIILMILFIGNCSSLHCLDRMQRASYSTMLKCIQNKWCKMAQYDKLEQILKTFVISFKNWFKSFYTSKTFFFKFVFSIKFKVNNKNCRWVDSNWIDRFLTPFWLVTWLVTWLATFNQSALFQSTIVSLQLNLFLTSSRGDYNIKKFQRTVITLK